MANRLKMAKMHAIQFYDRGVGHSGGLRVNRASIATRLRDTFGRMCRPLRRIRQNRPFRLPGPTRPGFHGLSLTGAARLNVGRL